MTLIWKNNLPIAAPLVAATTVLAIVQLVCAEQRGTAQVGQLSARRLADIPSALGLAGAYAGVANDALLIAGGSNFMENPDGTKSKTWHDDVYVLPAPDSQWKSAG